MRDYYEDNPVLFKALNLLKANSVVYRKYNPVEYDALVDMRTEADSVLAYDGCRLDVNPDLRAACIRFLPSDDYVNHLREKFTVKDMKVYVCLLQIYQEKFSEQGSFVSTDLQELKDLMNSLGFYLDTQKKTVTLASLREHIQKFSRFGIVRKTKDNGLIVNPGVLTCLSREEFGKIYDDKVRPWLADGAGSLSEEKKEETDE